MFLEPSFPIHVGRCIYCGRSDEKLSGEHVVPYALGGTWELLEASCATHRDFTSPIEGDVLHHAWVAARAVLKVRSRRPRPTTFPMKVEWGEKPGLIQVPTEEHPGPLVFLEYAPPGVTPAKPRFPGTPVIKQRMLHRPAALKAFAKKHGATAIRVRYPDPLKFAQFIAKVAHGFSVACYGVEQSLQSPLLAALLSNDSEIYRYVGNDPSLKPVTDEGGMYSIAIRPEETGRVAYVRLLSLLRTPEYLVRLDSPGAS